MFVQREEWILVEGWKVGWVEGWMSGRVDEWKDGRVEGWKGGEWVKEWKGGGVDELKCHLRLDLYGMHVGVKVSDVPVVAKSKL